MENAGIYENPHNKKDKRKVMISYEFDTMEKAKECIICVKEAYKKFKGSILRKSDIN